MFESVLTDEVETGDYPAESGDSGEVLREEDQLCRNLETRSSSSEN
jgi:hypothetical protein